MRSKLLLAASVALLLATGCSASTTSFVRSDTTLGRVVVYRNGVAYFERSARVEGDTLHLSVPADKVDDFLKSLTVVDARSGEPAPIAYPTQAPTGVDGFIDMQIRLQGEGPHDLRLSYVTEAPSWKPSYRIVLGDKDKVNLQAWAIIDNTSGEDWSQVKLGVGASSALSFRYDLWSVREVRRETLRSDDLFAQAPPMGGASYGGLPSSAVLADLSDEALRPAAPPMPVVTADSMASQKSRDTRKEAKLRSVPKSMAGAAAPAAVPGGGEAALANTARRVTQMQKRVVVEGYADQGDSDKFSASLARANRMREQLISQGVAPEQIVAVGKGEVQGRGGSVRLVEAIDDGSAKPRDSDGKDDPMASGNGEPIGTSHFESLGPMTLARGSSAMVSILQQEAEGEVVYLYDAESPRGNAGFPFRSVRVRNPTDSALESGPVTVFGEGKFIGEGLSEPIPARQVAFIPFALDRQIVVERKEGLRDEISRIISVQRGVFSTEVQHTRRTTLTLTNRLADKAVLYIKHTVPKGYALTKSPKSAEKLGEAQLFRVELAPGSKTEIELEEATPIFKSTDIRSNEGMGLVKLFLSSGAAKGQLKEKVGELVRVQQDIGTIEQQISTMRDQMSEYRSRMEELHAQLVTLRAVKGSSGGLMSNLEKKMQEVSDKLSRSTVDLVALQEKLMVSRIKFQDGVAELSLEAAPPPASVSM